MAFKNTLELDGLKDGPVEILAWSWGEMNAGSANESGGGGPGRVSMQDVSLTKYVDKSSPMLYLLCAAGDKVKKGRLTVRSGDKDFMRVSFEECFITSVQTGGSEHDERLTENLTLAFGKVKWEVGTAAAGYDCVAQAKL